MRKWITRIMIALTGTGIVLGAPIVPEKMEWVRSYETIAFDTTDGDLGMNEYAIKGDGEWYVRDVPASEGNFVSTTTEPKGKKEVQIRAQKSSLNETCDGCAYYSEFRSRGGQVVRVNESKQKYDALRSVPAEKQPEKIEFESILAAGRAEAAIAYDNVSNDTAGGTSASSISWSHTVNTASNTYAIVACLQDNDGQSFTSTFDGSATTELFEVGSAGGVGDHEIVLAFRAAASTGAKTVACTSSATGSFNGIAVTYTGVQTVDETSDTSLGGDSGVEPSRTVTTVSGSVAVMFCGLESAGLDTTPGANQTNRFRDQTFTAEPQGVVFEDETATGVSVTMTCERTNASTLQWTIGAVELEAAADGGGGGATGESYEIIYSEE